MHGKMMMTEISEAIESVIRIVRDEIRIPNSVSIDGKTCLVTDLKIDGDDLSFLVVPRLEREFKNKLSLEVWSKISTVEEIAEALINPTSHTRR
jgi:acyl carrier protein